MGFLKPIVVGMKRVSETLSALYVRNSSATEMKVYDTDGYLYQNGIKCDNPPVMTKMIRLTIAQINAGYDLITPTATGKIKVVNCWMRAIGGAVGAVTTIDIKEETSGNIVFQAAQANLTQNTILLPNSTGVTATYLGVESTAGKKLTCIKAGSDITTATHVDVCVSYINTVA